MRNLKKLSLFFCLMALLQVSMAQTTYTVKALAKKSGKVELAEASQHNVWVGSKITGSTGSGDLSENLLLSGKVVYDLTIGSVKFPIVSNVSIKLDGDNPGDITTFLFGDKGLGIGIYPYKVISETAKLTTVIHGGVGFKLLPKADAKLSPKQTKIFGGVEFAYKVTDTGLPLTLSVTPAYLVNNLENINQFVLEGTAVLPVAGGLGVLAELTTPFKSGYDPIFKIGFIINGKL